MSVLYQKGSRTVEATHFVVISDDDDHDDVHVVDRYVHVDTTDRKDLSKISSNDVLQQEEPLLAPQKEDNSKKDKSTKPPLTPENTKAKEIFDTPPTRSLRARKSINYLEGFSAYQTPAYNAKDQKGHHNTNPTTPPEILTKSNYASPPSPQPNHPSPPSAKKIKRQPNHSISSPTTAKPLAPSRHIQEPKTPTTRNQPRQHPSPRSHSSQNLPSGEELIHIAFLARHPPRLTSATLLTLLATFSYEYSKPAAPGLRTNALVELGDKIAAEVEMLVARNVERVLGVEERRWVWGLVGGKGGREGELFGVLGGMDALDRGELLLVLD